MKQKTLNGIIASYEKDEERIRNDNDSRKYIPTSTSTSTSMLSSRVGQSYLNKNVASSCMKISGNDREGGRGGGGGRGEGGGGGGGGVRDANERCVEDDIVWCNGRCNGTADGPLCSSICIKLWSERVLQARKTMTVKQAIARQHHSGHILYYIMLLYYIVMSCRVMSCHVMSPVFPSYFSCILISSILLHIYLTYDART